MSQFDQATITRLRDRLEAERAELGVQLSDIGVDPETGAPHGEDFEHGFADSGQATAEKARVMGVAQSLVDTLHEVQAALKRIDEGRFGLCTSCGDAIPIERLEARPHAALCVRCKQRSA